MAASVTGGEVSMVAQNAPVATAKAAANKLSRRLAQGETEGKLLEKVFLR